MTRLSFWAKHHTYQARTIIILLHVILILLAIYTGITLAQLALAVPVTWVYITILLYFAAVLVYPNRRQKNFRFSKQQLYVIRKCADFVLAASSFILVCFTANHYADTHIAAIAFTTGAASITKAGEKPGAEAIIASLAHRNKSTLTRSEKRILKNEFGRQLKIYAKAKLIKDEEAAAKAVFIILSIIGAVGLTFLLASLACNISCNGSGALAIVVTIAGLTAIIFLLIAVIKKIKSHKKKEKDPVSEVKPA